MLPPWLALLVSIALHLTMLLAPGWGLPFAGEAARQPLAATLAMPAPAVAPAPRAMPRPARRKANVPPAPPASVLPTDAPAAPATAPAPPLTPVAAVVPAPALEVLPDQPAANARPTPTFADIWPTSGRIVFQVTRGDDNFIVGRSEHRWEHDGANYRLVAVTETTGLAALFKPATVTQESRGVLVAGGLQPLEFRAERGGRSGDVARFNLLERRVDFGGGQSAAFAASAQDMLSLFYQLGVLAAIDGKAGVTVVTGRKLADYVVAAGEDSVLDTPLGVRRARHFKIAAARGGSIEDTTEVWLDTALFLPLKIRHRDRKGEVYDQIVSEMGMSQ